MDLGRFNKLFFILCLSAAPIYSTEEGVKVATEDLWTAVKNYDPPGIRDAIENHADVNAKNESGVTALHLAAEKGYATIISVLLKMGADKEAQLNCSDRPLHLAAANGKIEAVGVLIVAGATINVSGCKGIPPKLLADRAGRTLTAEFINSLQYSHKPGNTTAVDEVNAALIEAVNKDDHAAVRDALEGGANLEAVLSNGNRPLHVAAEKERFKAMSVLLKAGASVDARNDKNNTALHIAIQKGDVDTTSLLIAAGADIQAIGEDGRTPLLLAFHRGSSSRTVNLLRAVGGWRFSK